MNFIGTICLLFKLAFKELDGINLKDYSFRLNVNSLKYKYNSYNESYCLMRGKTYFCNFYFSVSVFFKGKRLMTCCL